MSSVSAFLTRSRQAVVQHCQQLLAKNDLAGKERDRLARILAAVEEGERIGDDGARV